MTTWWTRGGGNQVRGRKKKEEHIGRFKLFLHRGINNVHEFSCMCNAVCVHVTCTVVTVHAICEGLKSKYSTHKHVNINKNLHDNILSESKVDLGTSVDLKGTLMQIWKFHYMLDFIKKQYAENIAFLNLKILELFTRAVCIFIKK